MENGQAKIMKSINSLIKKSKLCIEMHALSRGLNNEFVIQYRKHSKFIMHIMKILNDSDIYYKCDKDHYNFIYIPVHTKNMNLKEYWVSQLNENELDNYNNSDIYYDNNNNIDVYHLDYLINGIDDE
jgi:hypothetical protein